MLQWGIGGMLEGARLQWGIGGVLKGAMLQWGIGGVLEGAMLQWGARVLHCTPHRCAFESIGGYTIEFVTMASVTPDL